MRQVVTPELLELAKHMMENDNRLIGAESYFKYGKDEHHEMLKAVRSASGDIELDMKEDTGPMNRLFATCLARALSYIKACTWMDLEPFLNLETRYDRYCVGCYITLKPKNKVSELDNEILDEMQRVGRALDKVASGGGDG